MHVHRKVQTVCCLALLLLTGSLSADPTRFDFRRWGDESLASVERDFHLPQRSLYAQKSAQQPPGPAGGPSFLWDGGVQLSALAAAARVAPDPYLGRLRAYADGLQAYWIDANGIGGYNVLPGMNSSDRYYDDNVWIALALAETYEVTGDRKYLARAMAAGRYVFSGEDSQLGGGIYWREAKKESKNTCVNAPAIVAAMRLYQLTGSPVYFDTARRLYVWTCTHLQDPGGLFWDNIRLDGTVGKAFYSYNTGLMIRANSMLHAATGDPRFLAEAQREARAAAAHWVRPQDGAITDGGRFAHLLLEGFLAVGERDNDPRWRDIARRAITYTHEKVRDPAGHYGGPWDKPVTGPIQQWQLLDQASVARAFWIAAGKL